MRCMVSVISTATIGPATDTAPTREQAAARRDQARLEQARSALQAMKARGANRAKAARDERKALAKKKVDQLKALLKSMQMGGGSNAKALAQVARELKAAVQAYGGAGGSTAGLGASTETATSATPAPDVEGPSVLVSGEAEASTASGPPANGAEETTPADTDGDGSRDAAKTAAGDPYRRMAEASTARTAEAARRNADKEADREFLSSVRELAALLKSLARRAAQAAETDPTGRADADAAVKAADAVVQSVEQAAADLGAGGVSVIA